MSDRMAPFHCPYCGEEDLRPNDAPRAWECRSCLRVFSVVFLGLLAPPGQPAPAAAQPRTPRASQASAEEEER